MKVGELVQSLQGWDPEMEVEIELRAEEGLEPEDGDLLQITDERSLSVKYGKVVIIGDAVE